jgi:hypothetical protein
MGSGLFFQVFETLIKLGTGRVVVDGVGRGDHGSSVLCLVWVLF